MDPDQFLTGDPETDAKRREAYFKLRDGGLSEAEATERIMRIVPHQTAAAAPTVSGALRSVAQGATFGLADEAEAGIRSLVGPRSYSENVSDIREDIATTRDGGGGMLFETIGALGSGAAVGGLLKGGAKLAGRSGIAGRAGQAAQRGLDIGKAAFSTGPRAVATNAALGGAYSAGAADEDRLTQGAIGAGAGAAAGLAAPAVRGIVRALKKPSRAALAGAGGVAAYEAGLGDGIGHDDIDNALLGGAALALPSTAGRFIAPRVSRRAATSMADDRIASAMAADRVTPQSARETIKGAGRLRGPEVSVADLGGNLTGVAQGASAIPDSRAADVLPDMFEQRVGGRLRRTTADLEDAVGVPVGRSERLAPSNPNQRPQGILPRLRGREAGPLYDQARGTVAPRQLREVAMRQSDSMDKARRAAARIASDAGDADAARRLRSNDLTLMSTDEAMYMRQALDDMLNRGTNNPSSLGRNARRQVQGLRSELDDALKGASDPLRAGDEAFARRSQQIDAIDLARGTGTGNKRFSLKAPEEVQRDLASLAPDDQLMYRIGAIDDLRKNIDKSGNMESRIAGRNEDSFNEQGLRILIGDDSYDQLAGRLDLESRMQETAGEISRRRGSRTFRGEANAEDANKWGDIRQIAIQAFREMFPDLRTSRNVADEISRIMELRGDDLLTYLDELEGRLIEQAQQRGVWDRRTNAAGAALALGAGSYVGRDGG